VPTLFDEYLQPGKPARSPFSLGPKPQVVLKHIVNGNKNARVA
jgi:hypothetical protein